jgi:hypothetical protein
MTKGNEPRSLEVAWPEPPSWPDAPTWVPALIREQALLFSIEYNAPEAASLARRLASDPRMKVVWKKFDKMKRLRPEQYVNPYCDEAIDPKYDPTEFQKLRDFMKFRKLPSRQLPKLNPSKIRDLQAWAVWRLFVEAFHFAFDRKPGKRVYAELRRDVEACRRLAPHLHRAAGLLEKYNRKSDARLLKRWANNFETSTPAWSPGMVTNNKGDWQVRSYVGALAYETHNLFLKNLPGTIARTASVALGIQLNADQVKSMIVSASKTRAAF